MRRIYSRFFFMSIWHSAGLSDIIYRQSGAGGNDHLSGEGSANTGCDLRTYIRVKSGKLLSKKGAP